MEEALALSQAAAAQRLEAERQAFERVSPHHPHTHRDTHHHPHHHGPPGC